jgi:hypothetical protein
VAVDGVDIETEEQHVAAPGLWCYGDGLTFDLDGGFECRLPLEIETGSIMGSTSI